MPTWETATDWDAPQSETGTHHEQPADSGWAAADKIEKGYSTGLTNLELLYPMNEASGTTIFDIIKNEDLTAGGATLNTSGGLLNNSFWSYDGSDDRSDHDIADITASDQTWIVWMKSWNGFGAVVLNSGDFQNVFKIGTSGGTHYMNYMGAGASGASDIGDSDGTWEMFTVVNDTGASERRFYRNDATLVDSEAGNNNWNFEKIRLGDDGNNNWFAGDLGHVAGFSGALSTTTISNLYQAFL